MKYVTKQEVLEAADWCAQLDAWLTSDEYDIGSLDEPPRPIHELACEARFGIGWLRASSILYAAALEGGPMPAGWEMARTTAARRVA